MTRTINAPGIEYNEIDRSQYNLKQDNSIVGTTSFICGFADKGEDYTTQWINSIQTLQETYGVPTNEPEKYFYNAGVEILNKGGVLLMSKLPYDNESKDKFTYVDYEINSTLQQINQISLDIDGQYKTISDLKITIKNILSVLNIEDQYRLNTIRDLKNTIEDLVTLYTPELNSTFNYDTIADIRNSLSTFIENVQLSGTQSLFMLLDQYLTSYIEILPESKSSNLLNLSQLDELEIGNKISMGTNTIRIVDITRSKYQSTEINCIKTKIDDREEWTNDCLGIIPVIISPMNALYFQNYSDPLIVQHNNKLSTFNAISKFKTLQNSNISADLDKLSSYYSIPLSSNDILTETISKIAVNLFPDILYINSEHFDTFRLKDIGIAIFKAYKDPSNKSNITFKLLESFFGSLDKNAKDPITKSTRYIDDIVNSQSNYIKLYSNIDQQLLQQCSTVGIFNQTATSLGFYNLQCTKKISYIDSILKPLETILENNKDRNRTQIDLVVDAGTSNIAQFVVDCGKTANNTIDFTYNSLIKNYNWKFSSNTSAWKTVLNKFDVFCKSTRKDCIFIADGLRTFCLDGDSKIIRSTNILNTIENSIIPKLRTMICLNSSYSVGYCNWFYGIDNYSGDLFWIPPSIKAAGIYTYTDAYFHKWDAPAGMTRGVVNNVVDCAFSPNIHEAGKIYQQCWNYAINYPLDGIVIEGQKTMQIQQTAFDRVNVRRLFLYLEKQVARYAKYFLYEGNTTYLRQRFVDTIRPIFDDAVNGNGILQYLIKCDDENNTAHTIDNNELHCQIIVKPVKTIEFIVLDFVCTNQSATVTETILTK